MSEESFKRKLTTPMVGPASVNKMACPRPEKPSIAVVALDNLRKPDFR